MTTALAQYPLNVYDRGAEEESDMPDNLLLYRLEQLESRVAKLVEKVEGIDQWQREKDAKMSMGFRLIAVVSAAIGGAASHVITWLAR